MSAGIWRVGQGRSGNSPERLNSIYDKWMVHPLHAAFFDYSDYYNYGYTESEVETQQEASENLVAQLLALMPTKTGRVLDVACGLGASTRRLLDYYDPAAVNAINISDLQLRHAHQNASGAGFAKMDATCLGFPDATFDNLLCIESVFHFSSREQFFREAWRVLRPGGWLALSDILGWMTRDERTNRLGPSSYGQLLQNEGFVNTRVVDATQQCTRACGKRLGRWPTYAWRAGLIDWKAFLGGWIMAQAYATYMRLGQRNYLLVAAQKPIQNGARAGKPENGPAYLTTAHHE